MALVGLKHDEYRYSPSLVAFYWFIKDGKFNPESFNEIYKGSFDFTKMVWGDMKGERWKDFDTVVDRLNAPELVDYYINTNITYNYKSGSTRTPYSVFSWKLGDCDDLASFGHKALKRAGYKTFGRRAYNGPGDAHIGLGLEKGDGTYFLVVDFSRRYGGKNRMSGPYNEIIEIDRMLGYGTRYSGRESFQF